MKKLILVILVIFLLSACKAGNTIYNSLYMASIGFEKNEEVYTGYFYLPSSVSVGNLEQTEAEDATIAKVDGSSISAIGNGLTWQESNGLKNSMQTEKIVPIGSFLLSKTLFQHTTAMGDFK